MINFDGHLLKNVRYFGLCWQGMLSFILSLAVRVLSYETICFLGPPLVVVVCFSFSLQEQYKGYAEKNRNKSNELQ